MEASEKGAPFNKAKKDCAEHGWEFFPHWPHERENCVVEVM